MIYFFPREEHRNGAFPVGNVYCTTCLYRHGAVRRESRVWAIPNLVKSQHGRELLQTSASRASFARGMWLNLWPSSTSVLVSAMGCLQASILTIAGKHDMLAIHYLALIIFTGHLTSSRTAFPRASPYLVILEAFFSYLILQVLSSKTPQINN